MFFFSKNIILFMFDLLLEEIFFSFFLVLASPRVTLKWLSFHQPTNPPPLDSSIESIDGESNKLLLIQD